MQFPIVVLEWTEYERGWGARPDGVSIHIDEETKDKYVKDYWDRMPKVAPDEYSKDGSSYIKNVNEDLYNKVKRNGSIRLFQGELQEMERTDNEPQSTTTIANNSVDDVVITDAKAVSEAFWKLDKINANLLDLLTKRIKKELSMSMEDFIIEFIVSYDDKPLTIDPKKYLSEATLNLIRASNGLFSTNSILDQVSSDLLNEK